MSHGAMRRLCILKVFFVAFDRLRGHIVAFNRLHYYFILKTEFPTFLSCMSKRKYRQDASSRQPLQTGHLTFRLMVLLQTFKMYRGNRVRDVGLGGF